MGLKITERVWIGEEALEAIERIARWMESVMSINICSRGWAITQKFLADHREA